MDYPFTTDGCSGGHSFRWKVVFGTLPPWQDCCLAHDTAYWKGGTRANRRQADNVLFYCVLRRSTLWAWTLWIAVRIGGHPLLPTPWRWGYGWRYPRGYR